MLFVRISRKVLSVPAVSVIIPNYNHALYLQERFDSVLRQTFQDFEIILLDDCSTDDSDVLLRQFSQHPKVRTYIRNTANSGSPFVQWRRGLELSSAPLVWIAESDDVAEPRFLETLVPALLQSPNWMLAFCRSQTFLSDPTNQSKLTEQSAETYAAPACARHMTGRHFIRSRMQGTNGIPNASAVVFRRFPELPSLIPTEMRYCGDWVTWVRLLRRGGVICFPDLLNHWRSHPQTTRWDNAAAGPVKYFWEYVQRPAYMREMLIAMLELRPDAGIRWNTWVFMRLLEHYEKLAGATAREKFLSEMSCRTRIHLHLKETVRRLLRRRGA